MSYHQTVQQRPRPLENWSVGAYTLPRGTDLATEAGKLLEDVRSALEHDLSAAVRATAHLAALLGSNGIEMPRAAPARGGLAPWQERKIRDHIESRLERSIPVGDLARLVSLSPSHFGRAFKESLGVTPHAYVMRRRLERAQEMMLATPESLSQIALVCGHADQAHFSRRFRREMGETPNAWRRRHAKGDWAMPDREPGSSAREALPHGSAWVAAAG
jgi:AraC family transcriptional regulator